MRARSHSASAALVTLLALVLSGCGDDAGPRAASPTSSSKPPTTTSAVPCTDYLIVTVRGTGEPLDSTNLLSPVAEQITRVRPGDLLGHSTNLLSPVAEQITRAHPGRTRHHDVPYPASAESLSTTPGDAYFGESADEGVRMVLQQLNDAATSCPAQQSVVMGFSQGALVVGDALIDAEKRDAGREEGALSPQAADNLRAAVLYGDPRFVGSEPFNAGTYNPRLDGMMKPRSRGDLDAFAGRLRSFCVAKDLVCQSGGQFEPHVSYFDNGMRAEGAEFALGRLD